MNYVEKCLYDYKANIAEIEALIEKRSGLMSMRAQSYHSNNSYEVNDPVGNTVNQKLAIDKRISKLEKCVKAVEKLVNDLNGSASNVRQMAGILQLRYIQHEDKEVIKEKIRISERTFWRRVKELIRLAKRYLGDFHA